MAFSLARQTLGYLTVTSTVHVVPPVYVAPPVHVGPYPVHVAPFVPVKVSLVNKAHLSLVKYELEFLSTYFVAPADVS